MFTKRGAFGLNVGVEGVEEDDDRHSLATGAEATGDFVSDNPTAGVTAEVVRAAGLLVFNRRQIEVGHGVEVGLEGLLAVNALGLEAVEGDVLPDVAGEVAEVEDVATGAMDAEEGRLGGVDRD